MSLIPKMKAPPDPFPALIYVTVEAPYGKDVLVVNKSFDVLKETDIVVATYRLTGVGRLQVTKILVSEEKL